MIVVIGRCLRGKRDRAAARGAVMGMVIRFPEQRPSSGAERPANGSASIVILPVIRVERQGEGPSGDHAPRIGGAASGKRRRARRN